MINQMYVQFMLPQAQKGKKHNAIGIIHGCCLSTKSWQTTPDGLDGPLAVELIPYRLCHHRALADTGKVAVGQLIMGGRAHSVGIKALRNGLMLSILRYADELRDPKPYFEGLNVEAKSEAVGLAKELIEAETGRFEPEKIPDRYAETLRELLQAKVEQRAPQIEVATESKAKPEVVNIMAALKESMQTKGRNKVRDAVRRRMGKPEKEEAAISRNAGPRPSQRRTAH